MKKENPYILPKLVKPVRYSIELAPDLDSLSYSGSETITLDVLEETGKIVINCKDVEIIKAEIDQKIKRSDIVYDPDYETATIFFEDRIKKGKASMHIEFEGRIHEDMRGFYKSDYTDAKGAKKVMGATQFEATDARKCFPCFDEPAMKAVFGLTLIMPKDLTAVSNMPVKEEKMQGAKKRVEFHDTPIMSSYLLAFAIGELEHVEGKTKQGTKVRIITTPGRKHQGNFALEVAIKSLEYYNNYFGMPYPLPKLDLIAIPDFEAGAMENWGLVTYRETALLIDEEISSAAARQRVAIVIAHELAHMWFGNLVTMRWWNDLWLNEGFASWMEYKALDCLFPEWDIWTQFYHENVSLAMASDGLESTHPIEVEIINPNEISETFGTVVYNKGAAIIRMLEQYLGEKTFQKGLQGYLSRFKYSNAVTDDLWSSLSEASKKPVKVMMDSWTKQLGYPMLDVRVSGNKLLFKQERFFFTGRKQDQSRWFIPIAIKDNNKTRYYELSCDENGEIAGSLGSQVNADQVGYYMVRYDESALKMRIDEIKNKRLSSLDRVGLASNVYSLARSNYIPATDFLSLILAYQKETDYTVFSEISTDITQLQSLFSNAKFSDKLNKFIRRIFQETYRRLGWDEKPNEEHTTKLLRAIAISMMGFSEDPEVLNEAKRRFSQYLKDKKLNPNIRSVVYALAAWCGDNDAYEKLLSLHKESGLQEEKVRLLRALGLFKQKDLLSKTLAYSLSSDVRQQDTLLCAASVAMNPHGKDLAWEFFKDNWNTFYERYGKEGHMMPYFVKYLTAGFSTIEKREDVDKFFTDHQAPTAKRAIEQSLEDIQVSCNFIENNEKGIAKWLNAEIK